MSELARLLDSTGHWSASDANGRHVGNGSCWRVGRDLVITNHHVAVMGPEAEIEFASGITASVLGLVAVDPHRDLAVAQIKFSGSAPPALSLNDTLPSPGAEIYAVGSPLGLRRSLTRGIVSAIRQPGELNSFGTGLLKHDVLIQVDAAISPGSSGGPIADAQGRVVAVSTLGINGGQALNFGVPTRYVSELLRITGRCQPLAHFLESHPSGSEADAADEELSVSDRIACLLALLFSVDGFESEAEHNAIIQVLIALNYPPTDWGRTLMVVDALQQKYSHPQMVEYLASGLSSLPLDMRVALWEAMKLIAESDGLAEVEAHFLLFVARIWGLAD